MLVTASVLLNRATARFTLDAANGVDLLAGHSMEFVFPDFFKGREILQVILKHRKDPEHAADKNDFLAYDANAAYILCEAHSSIDNFWYRWADRSSYAKFSEVRTADNPENETLHNGLRTFGRIKPDRFRLTNVATGDPALAIARVHELEIVFAPDLGQVKYLERIFTPETVFADAASGRSVPLLGGGPRLAGRFPGAIILGKNRDAREKKIGKLPSPHFFVTGKPGAGERIDRNGNMLIDLPTHRSIEMIELAIGDLDVTNPELNKDGYTGRSGMAQVSVYLQNSASSFVPLLEKNNVGMAGMIICGGPLPESGIVNSAKLLIKVENDEAFLMGYRIAYR
jgi:hypothetical protein